jgi:tyrosyl-tRNA synthetase
MKLEEVMKNAVDCIDQKEMQERLQGNRPLRIKLGMDPTSPDLHLGHAVVLEKLRQFQENGHIILFVIGDFTAMIGDPSGRNKVRKALSIEEIRQNAQTYVSQVSKILDVSKAEIRYNSEWLSKITMEEMILFMSHFTLSQILERDDFHKRFKNHIDKLG